MSSMVLLDLKKKKQIIIIEKLQQDALVELLKIFDFKIASK